jgi:HEPN domain-containing protein
MAVPKAIEARRFYHVAFQRLEDARLLLSKLQRAPAAIYLAGYAVECILKSLILSSTPVSKHRAVLAEEFRGARAHSIVWLRERLRETGAASFPPEISRDLTFVSTWSVDLRYTPGIGDPEDAEQFVQAVERIVKFADGRLN